MARRVRRELGIRIGIDLERPEQWREPRVWLQEMLTVPPYTEALTSRFGAAVDQLVGDCRHRLLALAFEIEVLNRLCLRLEAVAADELVVEVLLARAHATYVEGDEGAHRVSRLLEVLGDA